jgi:hypothetical protein
MTYRHQTSHSRTSKNTTVKPISKSAKTSERYAIDVKPKRPSCASLRPTKISSTAPKVNASGLGPIKTAGKPASRRKASHALTTPQVRLIMKAALHAIVIGLPLNRFITINWALAGIDDAPAAQAAFLKLLRDWLGSLEQATAYVWVQERGTAMGIHSHILIHIPPSLIRRLGQLQRGWLKRIGATTKKGTICSKPIGLTSHVALSSDPETHAAYRQNLDEVVAYILKGADTKARRTHGITRASQCSHIFGKRAGT